MKRFSIFIFLSLFAVMARAENLKEIIESIQTKLNLSIVIDREIKSSWEQLTYSAPFDTSSVHQYLVLLEKEYTKYPKGYFNKINLKRIVLVEELMLQGQSRAAVPDPYGGSLFLDVKKPKNRLKYRNYQTHVMHHELHHYAEYSYWKTMSYNWTDWNVTNDSTFFYQGGGATAYENLNVDWYRLSYTLDGFMNLYSTTAQEEDRAELVALIMGDEERKYLKVKLRNDSILQQKVLLIQILLAEISGHQKAYWSQILH